MSVEQILGHENLHYVSLPNIFPWKCRSVHDNLEQSQMYVTNCGEIYMLQINTVLYDPSTGGSNS